jgi:hypothetical protein
MVLANIWSKLLHPNIRATCLRARPLRDHGSLFSGRLEVRVHHVARGEWLNSKNMSDRIGHRVESGVKFRPGTLTSPACSGQ